MYGQTDQRTMFYGEIGIGFSSPNVPPASIDYNANISATFGKKILSIRATIITNGVLEIVYPAGVMVVKNVQLGKYISVYHQYDANNEITSEWNILVFAGFTKVKNILYTQYIKNHETYIDSKETMGHGFSAEIDFQYLLTMYRGASFKLFYNFNNVHRFYGASFAVMLGFL